MSKIPSNEISWVCISTNENLYMITSDVMRTTYYIYEKDGDSFIRLGKGKNPRDLENKYVKYNFVQE